MNISTLPAIKTRSAKIVGRGIGSGKGGHTTGRGQKGQKARERVPQKFEGTKTKKSLIKRLPMLRGKSVFKPWGQRYVAIDMKRLEKWPAKDAVSHELLVKAGLLRDSEVAKIVGESDKAAKLNFKVAVTGAARAKIEAAGGTIE